MSIRIGAGGTAERRHGQVLAGSTASTAEASCLKLLITGASGQLGRRLLELSPHENIGAYHGAPSAGAAGIALNLEDPDSCRAAVARVKPDWIIHGAAMTNVDGCEADPKAAHAANAEGTGNLAMAAAAAGARMVYVSTDYVFDGTRGNYRETDAVNPISEYGRSKLEGERLALATMPDVVIARTSVVYGPHKKNFVTWLLDELRAGRGVRIVEDQVVSPTLTRDLAEQILALVQADASGIFHTAGGTALSRLDMAREIARVWGLDASLITPIRSSDLTWKAQRPLNSSLDVSKIAKYKVPLRFDQALEHLKAELGQRGS